MRCFAFLIHGSFHLYPFPACVNVDPTIVFEHCFHPATQVPSILGVVKPEYTAGNTSMYFNISQNELGELPALTPPPEVRPNFDHPESRAFAVLVVNGIFTALLVVFVALRLYSKISIFQSFDWEDG